MYTSLKSKEIPGVPRSPSKNPQPNQHPSQYRNLAHENVEIKSEDNVLLRGWHIFHEDVDSPSERLILYYH